MLRILRQHWQGENGLWTSLLICTLLLAAVVFISAVSFLGSLSPDLPPYSRMIRGTTVFLIVLAFGIWQLVGTWRASSAARTEVNYRFSRWTARLGALGVAAMAIAMFAMLPSLLIQLYDLANDRDHFGLEGNSVLADGTNLLISGHFSWGLLDKVEAALAANPDIDTVVLNSPGGHSGVGRRLSTMFAERHLDTAVVDLCASACTYAFSGGQHRLAGRKARIGFHAEASNNPQTLKLSQANALAFWTKFGLPQDFIQKANDTPPEDVWFPSLKELQQVNLVTDLIR